MNARSVSWYCTQYPALRVLPDGARSACRFYDAPVGDQRSLQICGSLKYEGGGSLCVSSSVPKWS